MTKRLFLTLALLTSLNALAHDYRIGQLEVDHPWSRPTPPNAQVGGGFMTITNHGDSDDRLINVIVDFAQRVEIHETRQNGEMMRMVHLPQGLVIPAGDTVTLQPGGYHVMFMGLTRQFQSDDQLEAILEFEQAGSLRVDFNVETRSGSQMQHDHAH
ncbi:MAG: copper chaperone PCu(A)C [Saccharospirillum sp.]